MTNIEKELKEANTKLLLRVEKLKKALKLGIEMREAQCNYFSKRTKENLERAKELEKQFDDTAEDTVNDYQQTNLF